MQFPSYIYHLINTGWQEEKKNEEECARLATCTVKWAFCIL